MRKVIIAPSAPIVTTLSRSLISASKGYAAKGGAMSAPTLTPAEILAQETARELSRLATKAAERAARKAEKNTSTPAKGKAAKPTSISPVKSSPIVVAPPQPSPQELILQAVKARGMSLGEATIKLAVLENRLTKEQGEQALASWHVCQILPAHLGGISKELKDLARETSGLIQPSLTYTELSSSSLTAALREQVKQGNLSLVEARAMLRTANGRREISQIQLPESLISAPSSKEEKEGKTISVVFAMLKREPAEEERVKAALRAAFQVTYMSLSGGSEERRHQAARKLGWAVEDAYHIWEQTGELPTGVSPQMGDIEVEGKRSGKASELLAWSVRLLDNNADCQRVTFSEGTVLTVFYNDPDSTDPKVRAILGDPRSQGIAIRRVFIADSNAAHDKGLALMSDGFKVSTLKLEKGANPSLVAWPKPLKPGQYVVPTTVEQTTETGDQISIPALVLMQKITAFSVDAVLRHESIRAQGRGEALPEVESSLSTSGKRGGPVMAKQDYDRGGGANKMWMKAGNDRCQFSKG